MSAIIWPEYGDRHPEKKVLVLENTPTHDGPPISIYTRRQAFEDGILVDLMGTYDDWPAAMVREAGIKIPVAITSTVFQDCVSPIADEDEDGAHHVTEQLAPCQDIKGRLWDVLWLFAHAARSRRDQSAIVFRLHVVPNNPVGHSRHRAPKLVTLKAIIGPDDDGKPCITIMYPSEE